RSAAARHVLLRRVIGEAAVSPDERAVRVPTEGDVEAVARRLPHVAVDDPDRASRRPAPLGGEAHQVATAWPPWETGLLEHAERVVAVGVHLQVDGAVGVEPSAPRVSRELADADVAGALLLRLPPVGVVH